ncbi:four helix bundle protein [Aliifodinibius salicampi]|uniref:Four helix bundle protein n=1 Tax=Fodinibius salicampi TaxID=1920655 RepID=A0ABT3PXW6_9BACT|nr:four helix bundle protein [Fodinibius salicampi]MCW9712692.1 four helix bundle protein [Fodinibius salicampi]
MSYKNLDIWQRSRALVIDIHKMSLTLPKFELYETGSQIRRSMKAVKANIVEGYGRRRYKNDFIRFIIYALASTDETIDHLETLYETGSLKDEKLYEELHSKLISLAKMINNFLQSVQSGHLSKK